MMSAHLRTITRPVLPSDPGTAEEATAELDALVALRLTIEHAEQVNEIYARD